LEELDIDGVKLAVAAMREVEDGVLGFELN
jgi:DNA-directed RNA polymerase subunit K/omega